MVYSNVLRFDGSHFITNGLHKSPGKKHKSKSELDLYFDDLYKIAAVKFSVTPDVIPSYLRSRIVEDFGEFDGIDDYISNRLEVKSRSLYQRRKRFWSKALLNKFNYHYTQSYDSAKYSDEEVFRSDFVKLMQNFKNRRGWRYIIKWERGEAGNRLHAHCLVFIPNNNYPGIMKTVRDYSRRKRKIVTTVQNTFLANKFGRNDFEYIDPRCGKSAIQYVGKYLEKTDDLVTYSRGLATALETPISESDIFTSLISMRRQGDELTAYVRYITYDIIFYSPLVRWYRKDNKMVYPKSG